MQNHDENFWTLDTLIEGHYAEQIFKFFTEHITKGDLMPDERLPSYRVLAEKLGVHRNTMSNVYRMLQREDWIYIKVAQGTFVSETFPGYEKLKPYISVLNVAIPQVKPLGLRLVKNW